MRQKDLPVKSFVYRELTMEKDGIVGLLAVPVEETKPEKEKEDHASND